MRDDEKRPPQEAVQLYLPDAGAAWIDSLCPVYMFVLQVSLPFCASMRPYDEQRFLQQMRSAMATLRNVLERTKNPELASEVPHEYEDKYLAAEFLTNTAIVAVVNGLASIGMTSDATTKLIALNKGSPVSLRFASQETCKYLRETTRDVESATSVETEKTSTLFGRERTTTEKKTTKLITKVTEHFWDFEYTFEVCAFQGTNSAEKLRLCSRTGKTEIKTSTKKTPRPEVSCITPFDVNISYLLDYLNAELQPTFRIDRSRHLPQPSTAPPQLPIHVQTCFPLLPLPL